MIHDNAKKYLSRFEKINEYFGFDYISEYEFHDAEVDEIRIVPDLCICKYGFPTTVTGIR